MARLRDYFFADVKLKLLALLVVLVIWFSVAGQTRQAAPITIQNVAVTLDSLPAQYAVTSTDPTEVSVTVQGPEDLLRELRIAVATRSSDMMAHADLSKLTEGVQLARLTVRGLPDGVSLKKIEPDSVRVTSTRSGRRSWPSSRDSQGRCRTDTSLRRRRPSRSW
ncbi:MAG: YbbR-like domain-containing protein [Blastocatellia bacterium]|nr:YbbR-like domain-containing protein [Blastocatellia bacterium]